MRTHRFVVPPHRMKPSVIGTALLLSLLLPLHAADTKTSWPGFRGFTQSHASGLDLPVHWDTNTETAWSVNLAGYGQSSPVIWDDRVYVTSVAGPEKESLHLQCFSLRHGDLLWEKTWTSSFPEKDSDYISKAAPTPALDSDRIYVLFESGDLIALTHDGKEAWRRELTRDIGPFLGNHGQGASPALTQHGVVVLIDQKGPSFIASYDKATGRNQWITERDTSTAWSSPLVLEDDQRSLILTSGSGLFAAYDSLTGNPIWSYTGLDGNNVPSPATDGSIFLVGSGKKRANLALRLEQDRLAVAWVAERATSSFGSPLVHEGRAYFVSDAGIAYCYQIQTGEPLWEERIADSIWASPLATDDAVYFFGKGGKTTVIAASDEFRILSENRIEIGEKDRVYGYAVADGRIVIRLGGRLLCLGPSAGPASR